MVGLKIRKRSVHHAPYEKNAIVSLTRDLGLLSKGTLCRVLRCGTKAAEIAPLVGRFAGETLEIGVEFLRE
jgi:hypothetical protein